MATDTQIEISEAELLHRFLGDRIQNGGRTVPIDDLLAQYRQYRRELADLRVSLEGALESSDRGESSPLDLEDIFQRGRQRLTVVE